MNLKGGTDPNIEWETKVNTFSSIFQWELIEREKYLVSSSKLFRRVGRKRQSFEIEAS